jgi:hypothetical protein
MHARMRDVLAKKERALFARKNNKKKIDGSDEPLRYSGRPVISSRPGERAREGRKVDEDLEGRRGRKMMVGKTGRAFDLPAEDRLDDIKKGVREPLRELVEGNTTNKTKIFVCQLKAESEAGSERGRRRRTCCSPPFALRPCWSQDLRKARRRRGRLRRAWFELLARRGRSRPEGLTRQRA